MNWCFKCDLVNVGQQRQSACSTDTKFRKRSWHWGWGNPKLFVHLCLMVFPGILWVWLVRTTNFPVHSLSGFLQLRQWTVRGFHSDIASTERAGGHRHIRSNLSCLCMCVCVSANEFINDLLDTVQLRNNSCDPSCSLCFDTMQGWRVRIAWRVFIFGGAQQIKPQWNVKYRLEILLVRGYFVVCCALVLS